MSCENFFDRVGGDRFAGSIQIMRIFLTHKKRVSSAGSVMGRGGRAWSEADDERLCALWSDAGVSYAALCERLGRSRGSVASRKERLGLPDRRVVLKARLKVGVPKRGPAAKVPGRSVYIPGVKERAREVVWEAAPAGAGTVLEVGAWRCRYPYEGGLCCGVPVAGAGVPGGRSYCVVHAGRCVLGRVGDE